MSIILLILKIIGITILCILAIVLCLLLLVLFVPIRYSVTASKYEDSDFTAKVKITWLLHILNILAWYKDDLYYRVRITIFSIVKSDNLKKRKKNIEKRQNEIEKSVQDREHKPNVTEIQENKSEVKASNDIETANEEFSDSENIFDNNYDNNSQEDLEEEDEKKSLLKKICIIVEKILDFCVNIKDKIAAIYSKALDIIDDIDYYIDAVNDKRNQEIFSLCYNQLVKVLHNARPKIFKGKLQIGLDDPYSMGQMLSIYGILFPLIHDKIQLVPDYDREVMEGDLYIKGRVTLFVIIYAGVKIYFNRDFKRMMKILKKEGK